MYQLTWVAVCEFMQDEPQKAGQAYRRTGAVDCYLLPTPEPHILGRFAFDGVIRSNEGRYAKGSEKASIGIAELNQDFG
jgi:hypothetical protein